MKTTLDLPDSLMRRVKQRALDRSQKLKDAIAQLLELGMAAETERAPPRAPAPAKLKGHAPLTIDDIESAIAGGRD